ncbi:MAG: sensor histidine kinase [Spartobacteria bacterium]|nr:sensor histidine kinase [Spartobacteria bacterium]
MKYFVFLMLAVVFMCPAQVIGDMSGARVVLRPWTFLRGDDVDWAKPDADESAGTAQTVPELFDATGDSPMAWYRVRFDLPRERPAGGWGVRTGRILTSDEVYLNGGLIGGEGRIGADFVDAPQKERVYRLPGHLLQPEDNVLAVRVQSSQARGGLAGAVVVDAWEEISRIAQRQMARQKASEAFVLGLLGMTLVFWAMLYVRGVPHRGYLWIGMLIVLFTLVFGLESLLFYEAKWLTPRLQRIAVAALAALPAPFFMLSLPVFDSRWPTLVLKGLAGLCAALACFIAIAGNLQWCHRIEPLWMGLVLAGTAIIVPGFLRKGWGALPASDLCVFAGFLWLVAFSLVEYLVCQWNPLLPPFSLALHIGFAGLAASLAVALSIQYRATYRQLRHLSRQLVGTEEQERKRLAATLHNEIAPTLSAVKLDIQLLLRRCPREEDDDGKRIVAQLSDSINALRDFSHVLRPAEIDQLGLTVALRALAERTADQHGFSLELDLPEGEAPFAGISPDMSVTIYRAAQEAFNNIVRHASADSVRLTLERKSSGLRLRISDNGRGGAPLQANTGIGLLTLREHVDALAGTCRVTTATGKGMDIELWLPIN